MITLEMVLKWQNFFVKKMKAFICKYKKLERPAYQKDIEGTNLV